MGDPAQPKKNADHLDHNSSVLVKTNMDAFTTAFHRFDSLALADFVQSIRTVLHHK
ncbi:hypothetical protein AL08_07010 [Corynebacterium diphtheriae bv. gravis str. ISS 4746]|nr:hypothetical protein AL08_07010 [Corynebacterium diphtheriae bv. gravis str. ISS 4746]